MLGAIDGAIDGATDGAEVAGFEVAAPLPHAANTTTAAAESTIGRSFTNGSPVVGRP